MSIDNAYERRAAVCCRRLPWFRRFWPGPDGSMDQADRMQLAFVYPLGEAEGTPAEPEEPVYRPRVADTSDVLRRRTDYSDPLRRRVDEGR